MAKKKNSIKKEKIIEVLQQIPEKDLRSFLEKIIGYSSVFGFPFDLSIRNYDKDKSFASN